MFITFASSSSFFSKWFSLVSLNDNAPPLNKAHHIVAHICSELEEWYELARCGAFWGDHIKDTIIVVALDQPFEGTILKMMVIQSWSHWKKHRQTCSSQTNTETTMLSKEKLRCYNDEICRIVYSLCTMRSPSLSARRARRTKLSSTEGPQTRSLLVYTGCFF